MTFRRMEFHIPNKSFLSILHPWKIWDNGYKFLHPNPHRIDPTKKYGQLKYRHQLSPDRFVSFDSNDTHLQEGYQELDSTGMVILRYHGFQSAQPFQLLHSIDNLFGMDMNQDCRLSRNRQGELWMTYNAYFHPDECRMIRRKVHLDFEKKFLYLYEEMEMIPPRYRQPVEKNCVVDADTLYYSFHKGVFTVIKDNVQHHCPVPFLQDWVKQYNHSFLFSLGTPPIEIWPGRHVAVGHVKVEFHRRRCCLRLSTYTDSFQEFVESIDWSQIYQHGKYVYFMFFFEFNSDYKITRISHCYLPTDNANSHLPYLLTFPSGWTADPERYHFWLSYGEGDVRCKVLTMSRDDVDNLLFYPETQVGGVETRFLNVDEWNEKPKVYHVGYFFEKNCGDDMFRVVFQTLRDRYYPDVLLYFRNQYKTFPEYRADRDRIVLGGGDIVNEYFLNSLFRNDGVRKDAVSIGIPYVDNEWLLTYFQHVSLRSVSDWKRLSPSSDRVHYYPDLGFLMPMLMGKHYYYSYPACLSSCRPRRPRLGVCLARTFFKVQTQPHYIQFIWNLVQAFSILAEQMDIYLIPFCTRSTKPLEDDNVIHQHVKEFFRADSRVVDTSPWVVQGDPVFHTYSLMSHMDCMLCCRFHSHVFSMALQIPFVSLSHNRKVVHLLQDFHVEDRCFPFEDVEGLPVNIKGDALAAFLLYQFDQQKQGSTWTPPCMNSFLAMWTHFIATGNMHSLPLEDRYPLTNSS